MANRSPTFSLRPVPPFRLDLTAWALRRRSRNLVDRWDGSTYRRVISVDGRSIELAVGQVETLGQPRLIVKTTPPVWSASTRLQIRRTLDRVLGLGIDLAGWYRVAARDPRLRSLAERFRGVKPPRFPSLFEALVNAFACQQLSLEVGLELLNRLSTLCGVNVRAQGDPHYAFPEPRDVERAPAARLRALGFSRQKVRAIVDLARAITRCQVDLAALDREPDDVAIRERLLGLRGVGRWTAEYVLLRGLGRLNVFPGDDVGAQKRLARWLGRKRPLDYAGVQRVIEPWQPYAGLVYFHLLLDGLMPRDIPASGSVIASRA